MGKRNKIMIFQPLLIILIALIFSIIYLVNIVNFANTIKNITNNKYIALHEATEIEYFIARMNNLDSTIDPKSSNYLEVKNEILFEKDCIKGKKSEGIYQSIDYLFIENVISEHDLARLCNDLDLYLDFIIDRIDNDKINSSVFSSVFSSLNNQTESIRQKISSDIIALENQLQAHAILTTVIALSASIIIVVISIVLALQQRKASKYLYNRNTVLNIITENSGQGIILYDIDHKRVEFETKNIQAYKKNYNDDFLSCMGEEDRNIIENQILNKSFNKKMNLELLLKNNDKSNWYYLSAIPVIEKNELKKVIFSISDFTEIKEYNQTLINAMNETKNANLAKRNFLSSMSHEIRTPITTIIGLTELSAIEINNPDKIKENLLNINQASNHLLSLVNDILEFSKIESGKIEIKKAPFLVDDLITSTLSIIKPQANVKSISLLIFNHTTVKRIIGDFKKLKQILINILNNSIKYTNPNGEISLTINEEINDNIVNLVFISKDNGIGMSDERLKKLFIPYERENYESLGTGLGLVITKDIITLMGGSIHVDSKINEGTTVTINIPFEISNEINSDVTTNYDFSSMKILLVEDNQINLKIIREFLTFKGAKVTTCDNGKKAVQKCLKESFDVVLMDIQMPVLNGYDATVQIRKNGYQKPIVALTANAFKEDIDDTIKSGMDDYLIKPITMNSLYEKINQFKK